MSILLGAGVFDHTHDIAVIGITILKCLIHIIYRTAAAVSNAVKIFLAAKMTTILICFIFSFNAKILAAQYDIGKIGIIWAGNINKLNHIDIIEAVFSTENVNKFYLSGDFCHECYK